MTDTILSGHQPRKALGEILRFMRALAQDGSIVIDRKVAASERRTSFRNAVLAHYMKEFGLFWALLASGQITMRKVDG